MMDLLSYPDYARVWIYSSDQEIPTSKIDEIQTRIQEFTKNWSSHNQSLKATGGILHNYFIVFIVDDVYNNPGGCSIDSSVHFIKTLELELRVDFFNRTIFYYLDNEQVKTISKSELASAYEEGSIQKETLFFDTLIQTKKEFQTSWLKPFYVSWHNNLM